jgi:acyl-CoA thioester hydrolase
MEKINLRELKLEDYPSITFDKIRYADTDRQGHVNNAVFSTFSETGRAEIYYDIENPLAAPDGAFVIANFNMDYIAEVNWPGRVDIGSCLTRVGTSSFSLAQGIYQDGKLCATTETTIVHVKGSPVKSSPLPEKTKETLRKYMMQDR